MMDEIGLDCELIEEPVWEQREAFLAINPAGEVPVLVDGNGLVLCGSYVITEYLQEGYQSHALMGASLAVRAEVRRLIHWADYKLLKEVTQPLLHEKYFRRLLKAGQPDTRRIRYGKHMLERHVDYFEGLLAARQWLAGEACTLADVSVATHISLYDYLGDMEWKRNSALKRWYALIKSRPAFRKLLHDRVRGIKPPAHYEDPDF